MSFTIGSLFDGSGGFPLAAFMCGGTPVWASEIEPYPIAVTKTRFPYMKHLGSVTDIKGNEVEPVDVITFGSPCQDLSVAGRRAGLKHTDNGDEETTRSGLFMEAVRIIKEMREATNGLYPRFALWENVPGAFSSNKGEDFRVVLEELIKIVEPSAIMPEVPKNGWAYADHYCGDGWSLAYRVLDAQFWGVPQRRRRIYLILNLRGQCAEEISFKRDGLRGYFETSRTPWQAVAGDAETRVGAADCEGECVAYGISPYHSNCMKSSNPHSGIYVADTARTLDAMNCGYPGCNQGGIAVVEPVNCYDIGEARLRTPNEYTEVSPTITARCGTGGNNVPAVVQNLFENHGQDARYKGPLDVCPMLPAQLGTGGNNTPFVVEKAVYESHPMDSRIRELDGVSPTVSVKWHKGAADTPLVCENHTVAYGIGNGQANQTLMEERVGALNCMHDQQAVVLDRAFYNQGVNAQYDPQLYEDGTCPTLVAKGPAAVCTQYIVRRLTPNECARLQGFPDNWAHPDIKDSFTDEEYEFWLNVRNNHAEINGKATKEYTKDQMLKWYNKLHTDSAEYKLWGNGIALPCAVYFMQGISEVFK